MIRRFGGPGMHGVGGLPLASYAGCPSVPCSAPLPPSGLAVAADGGYQRILLAWTDNSSDELGFRIECDSGGGYVEVDTVGAGVVTYLHSGLTPGTTYTYRVRAYNACGNSDYSNTDSDTTFDAASDIPGLYLWLIGDEGTYQDAAMTILAVGDADPVGGWQDQSGNGRHVTQGTAANRPTLQVSEVNGHSAIRFDGVNDYLRHSTLADWIFLHSGDYTIWIVFRTTDANPNAVLGLLGTLAASSANRGLSLWYDDRVAVPLADALRALVAKTGLSKNIDMTSCDGAAPAQTWNLVTYRYEQPVDGSDAYFAVDGLLRGGAETTNLPLSGLNPTYGLDIGTVGNAVSPLKGDIAEMIVSNQAVSDVLRRAVEDYLAESYNLTNDRGYDLPRAYSVIENQPLIYDGFGFCCLPQDGRILYVGRRGTQHSPEDAGKLRKWWSTDGGTTWNQADIWDSADRDDRNMGGGVVPATGTVMAFFARYITATSAWDDIWIMRSTDNGDTFANVGEVNTGADTAFTPYGPLVELPSGKLLQTIYGSGVGYYRSYIQYSSDDGLTWGAGVDIHNSAADQISETTVCYLSGATDNTAVLLAIARWNNGVLHQYSSADGGATWNSDGALPFSHGVNRDVSPWLYVRDDIVYLLYADRTDFCLYMCQAPLDEVAGNVTAWCKPTAFHTALTAVLNNFGYPSCVEYGGDFYIMFFDESGGIDCDIYRST